MQLKLLVSRAGTHFSQARGDEIEVDDAEACRMVDAGQAVPANEAAKAKYEAHKKSRRATPPKESSPNEAETEAETEEKTASKPKANTRRTK